MEQSSSQSGLGIHGSLSGNFIFISFPHPVSCITPLSTVFDCQSQSTDYFPVKGSVQKKIAEKETLVHMGGRGVKKIPFFQFTKKGTYSYRGRGQNLFVTCPMFSLVFMFPHNL